MVVDPDAGVSFCVTVVLAPAAQVSFVYDGAGKATMFPPETVAQSVPPTVAQPPRMPLVFVAVVTMPLVADCEPAGGVKSMVPPMLRAIVGDVIVSAEETLLFDVLTIAEAPGLTVRLATVWLDPPPLLAPLTNNVPPPTFNAEPLGSMLLVGAPAAVKSSASVPPLTEVVPP